MSSSRFLARSASLVARSDVCVFCHTRQQFANARNSSFRFSAGTLQPRRTYAQSLDVKRLRTDVDKRSRVGWYILQKKQGALLVNADKAEAIYQDFVAHKDKKSHGSLVKSFTTKYRVTMEDIAGIAMVTYAIPDLSDPTKRAMLPPSQHKTIAGLLLQGCADNEDPLAIKHIMTAVYLNNYTTEPGARDIAMLFPKSDILRYQKALEKLKYKSSDDPEALTLRGLFAERNGQRAEAKALYEKATQVGWVWKYAPAARHPAQLPIIAPWNALGYLLKADNSSEARAQAKHAFEQGANKGDDPLSYYELSAYHDRSSAEWLKCISKAAASGHREAMFKLAEFYRDVNAKDVALLQSSQMKKALNWLLGWRQDSAVQFAIEWFEAAGNAGHKAALMELTDLYKSAGDKEKERDTLRRIVEPATDGRAVEEWPQVVHRAKGRLSGVRTV